MTIKVMYNTFIFSKFHLFRWSKLDFLFLIRMFVSLFVTESFSRYTQSSKNFKIKCSLNSELILARNVSLHHNLCDVRLNPSAWGFKP